MQRGKNQKAKQTIMHCTTKQYNSRQEMKCNAMEKMSILLCDCTFGTMVVLEVI